MLILAAGCRSDTAQQGPSTADIFRTQDWRPVLVGSKYGYADSSNRLVLKPAYHEARHFSEGLAFVRIGEQAGYIDATGQMVIEGKGGGDFRSGLAVVMDHDAKNAGGIGEHWNYIDKQGDVVLGAGYYRANSFSEGLASVWPDEKSGAVFIDPKGTVVLDGGFSYGGSFSEGLAVAAKGGKWGFVDKQGKTLPPQFVYDAARNFSEGLAAVLLGEKWGFIDKQGNKVVEPRYEEVGRFSEGLAKFRLNGLWGFIDASGRVKIDPTFTDARDYSEGLAAVRANNGLWGYIGAGGSYRIQPRFEVAYGSENRTMLVKHRDTGAYGYVDWEGKPVHFIVK